MDAAASGPGGPVPEQVARLRSFAELLAWAMLVYGGGPAGLLGQVEEYVRAGGEVQFPLSGERISFGELPGSRHAAWILGLAIVRRDDPAAGLDAVAGGTKAFKNAATTVRKWYQGQDLGHQHFPAFCALLGVPGEVREYLEQRWRRLRQGGHGRFTRIEWDEARVLEVVDASRDGARHRPATGPVLPAPVSATARDPLPRRALRVVRAGRPLTPEVSADRLRLLEDGDDDASVLVAPDGSMLARRVGDDLRVARVNRVTGVTADWRAPVPLDDLPEGAVLAVSAAGRADLAFVWASAGGTELLVAPAAGGAPRRVARLAAGEAVAAVVVGVRTLVVVRRRDGTGGCPAFPGADVDGLVAASSGGRTLVLALGRARGATDRAAWVERDGRERHSLGTADVVLQLPLGWWMPPVVLTPGGQAAELSPASERHAPYEHWATEASATHAGTA